MQNHNHVFEVLRENGIKELRPPQKKVVERGLLDKDKNFLICIPTASGKTLIGEMVLINHLLDENKTPTNKKGLFIVPLKALASEKYDEFRRKYEKYGLKVALSIGDYDEKEYLSKYNIIITTAEKLDSLMRHNIDWLDYVYVAIVDEIHMINDEKRGGTLEVLLTKLKNLNVQIVGLSATIGNPEELAEWLNAELVIDNWRPVELRKGIFFQNKIIYSDRECKELPNFSNNQMLNLVLDCVKEGGCCLIFCNSKNGAVNEAKKLNLKKYLSNNEKYELQKLRDEILSILEPPTETCKALAECVEKGVAFHHAGLTYEHRKIVEEGFRNKLIKVICCTPTLCLNANTEILQESGFRKITELNKNEKIFALCGNKIKPVDGWKVHKTPQHPYNIVVKTKNGLEITTTPNHMFLVKEGKELCEKEAKDLKVGDYVATVDKIRIEEKDIDLSHGDLYFIGYFNDSELHKKHFLKNIERGIPHHKYLKKPRKIFNELNIDAFYNLPLEKLSYFIAGLFDGGGYINYNKKKIEFSSTSENLVKKLQLALLRFGVHSSIRKRRRAIKSPINSKEYKKRGIYKLIISDFISVKRFYENIPLKHKERRKLKQIVKSKKIGKIWCECYDEDIYWDRIKEIKKIKVNDKYAYDIELPDDGSNSHYIVANGFIVHNSAGINLPCRRAIVRDLMRFSDGRMRPIPIMEIYQCIGRAGRPGLDPYGEGIIFVKNEKDLERAEMYLEGKPEYIYSKLSNQGVLRTQLLGMIATREIENEFDLISFIKNTFYAHQYGNLGGVLRNIKEVIDFLEENEFIVDYFPTKLGKRISELYIDPLSAKIIIDGLNEMENVGNEELYYLYLISKTIEMMPLLRVSGFEELDLILEMEEAGIYDKTYDSLEAFKNAKMLYDWINEVPEEEILKKYKIEPGILRYKVEQAKWMIYSTKEIAKLLNKDIDTLSKLEIRLEHGAKEDILELLKIKHVGRIRARKLYDAGIRSVEDITKNPKKIASLLGEKIAKKILEELGVKFGQQTLQF
nr:DEAD/DEAH box helicase [Methanotorris formicicus]